MAYQRPRPDGENQVGASGIVFFAVERAMPIGLMVG